MWVCVGAGGFWWQRCSILASELKKTCLSSQIHHAGVGVIEDEHDTITGVNLLQVHWLGQVFLQQQQQQNAPTINRYKTATSELLQTNVTTVNRADQTGTEQFNWQFGSDPPPFMFLHYKCPAKISTGTSWDHLVSQGTPSSTQLVQIPLILSCKAS